MFTIHLIDDLYAQLLETLDAPTRGVAARLAYTLGLAPSPAVRWSRVFFNELTLGLPLFLMDAMPGLDPATLHDAIAAHFFGIVAAFAVDRIEDGQIQRPSPELLRVIDAVRAERDRCLDRIGPGPADPFFDFQLAEQATAAAAAAERKTLRERTSVSFEVYEQNALDKQHAAFPAAMRLALAAGFEEARIALVRRAIFGVVMALQMRDDASDWREDLAEGGSWAACLMNPGDTESARARLDLAETGRRVLSSGILARMVARGRDYVLETRSAAEELGAERLASWARQVGAVCADLAERESAQPGFTARWHEERRQVRAQEAQAAA